MRGFLCFCSFTAVLRKCWFILWLSQPFHDCLSLETQCASQITLSRTTVPFFYTWVYFHYYNTKTFIYRIILCACCFIHQTLLRWLVASRIWINAVLLQSSPRCFNRLWENMCLKKQKKRFDESSLLSKCKMRISGIVKHSDFCISAMLSPGSVTLSPLCLPPQVTFFR